MKAITDKISPHSRMLATFLSGIAEFERDLISERVKSGLVPRKRAAEGSAVAPENAPSQISLRRRSWR
ncbi:recombinase family protein [Sinorhizobium meliloti]